MTRERLPLLLALAALPIAPIGWALAQALYGTQSPYTSWWLHDEVTSVFSVPLFVSVIVNSSIVLSRYRTGTASYRLSRYPLWQGIVIVLGLAWIACIAIGQPALGFEFAIGVLLAITSIVTCVFAARFEVPAALRRAERLAARTPAEAQRARKLAIAVPLAIIAAMVVGIALVQNVEVTHESCEIHGAGNSTLNGAPRVYEVSTTNCGRFVLSAEAATRFDVETLLYTHQPFDITSRGFGFGLPPVAVAIDFAPSN